MEISSGLFYVLSASIVITSVFVVMLSNPLYSALSLAMTMIGLAAVYYTLNAPFIAGVQLIVYAGAVMVLFVMVIMLFDLKKEQEVFSKGRFTGMLKIASAGWLCGLIAGAVYMSSEMIETRASILSSEATSTTRLAGLLFTKYVFSFEALGVLLLVIAIGTVALSRAKGGSHAK